MASAQTSNPQRRGFGLASITRAVNELTIVVGFVAISLYLAITTPSFLTSANLLSILLASSLIGIVAVGETFVIVTGGIDLSVGSVVAFTGVMAGLALNAHLPVPVAIIVGIGIGALSGGFIAFAVTFLNMSPFIVSLAVLAMARGLAFIVTNGNTIFSFPDAFDNIGGGNLGPFPVAALITLLRVSGGRPGSGAHGLRRRGLCGRRQSGGGTARRHSCQPHIGHRLYHQRCARRSGWRHSRGQAGQCAADCGGRAGAECDRGGRHRRRIAVRRQRAVYLGTLLGVLIIGLINNGLTLKNVQPFWVQFIQGAVIFGAVLIDSLNQKRRKA